MLIQNRGAAAPSQQVRQIAALAIMLTAITLTLLIPAAHSPHAGPLTQILPWLMLSAVYGLLITAVGRHLRERRTRGPR